MGAREVHDAILATLKPGEQVPAEVKLPDGSLGLRYAGLDGYKDSAKGVVWPYDAHIVRIVRLLDTRTDDAEWVEVTAREYDEAWYREGKPRVRVINTRDSDGDWTIVRFIHRDDLTPPDPDGKAKAAVDDVVDALTMKHGCGRIPAGAIFELLHRAGWSVREHDAKAGEQS